MYGYLFDPHEDYPAHPHVQKCLEDINHGQFYKLISLDIDTRLDLKIQGHKLHIFLEIIARGTAG